MQTIHSVFPQKFTFVLQIIGDGVRIWLEFTHTLCQGLHKFCTQPCYNLTRILLECYFEATFKVQVQCHPQVPRGWDINWFVHNRLYNWMFSYSAIDFKSPTKFHNGSITECRDREWTCSNHPRNRIFCYNISILIGYDRSTRERLESASESWVSGEVGPSWT